MSYLHHISLVRYRNFSQARYAFHHAVTGITGINGSGKTNLLDAVYYLCFTKSYFQAKENANVQFGRDGFRLGGKLNGEEIVCKWKDGKKTIEHDGLPYERVTEHIGKFQAVMIAPDDVELINGGSDQRRKFADGLLAQSSPAYLEHLLLYQKYLGQRNAYLKQHNLATISHALLDVYDEQMALHGAALIAARQELCQWLPTAVQLFYGQISPGAAEKIAVHYWPCALPDLLAKQIADSRRRDIECGRSLVGPHAEDLGFVINDMPLKQHASQGQKKSFLIALKLAQVQWLQQLGKRPILLLDDIFEKLDRGRLSRLFARLRQMDLPQIMMTHTDAQDLRQVVGAYFEQLGLIEL
ncbi:MAG: DNA replication and repair protein RecF [Edaphocola sp.]